MPQSQRPHSPWQLPSVADIPASFVQAVRHYLPPDLEGRYLVQLLWQRGVRDHLAGFFSAQQYAPTPAVAFGQEMAWAVQRLKQAYERGETIAIWGDFDADGVTATSVLWDGLGQFFLQNQRLFYYIPNRLTESHGLSQQGLDWLKSKNCHLIVTCDTGSTNLAEIDYAHSLGLDVIVTDHHTLPTQRPPVIAIVNPRYLSPEHPLATLSGVAVAYKLVEALYEALPDIPTQPLETLLDLVAIGLIADLVELKGDCRYLAQRGIEQLQKQSNPATMTRPGIGRLLELCKRSGDRPTDISFGIGPRINAVSRIQGDAHFCVELLTSRDPQICRELAEQTELANSRRKALQKDVTQQVQAKLEQLDLSTTGVIVLWDEQWNPGVLGLVAGQIAQEFGRPTILLSSDDTGLARGSARSTNKIDLYELVKAQSHLLHRFGGHPFAAGLSLPLDNVPLFSQAINQRVLQQHTIATIAPTVSADLCITVAELGRDLYRELRLIEPCGMGNPMPRLFIQNCWFEVGRNTKMQDFRGRKVEYIRTPFTIWDDSVSQGFPGIWWGHYAYEFPQGRCDAIVELENNTYRKQYEVRLIAVRPCNDTIARHDTTDWLIDWRSERTPSAIAPLEIPTCPSSWDDLQGWLRRALQEQRPCAIAYPAPQDQAPQEIWQTLLGLAKYMSRTGETATRQQLCDRLGIGDRPLRSGLVALQGLGFQVSEGEPLEIRWTESALVEHDLKQVLDQFFATVHEEQFRRQYFYQMPIDQLNSIAQLEHRNFPQSNG
jgi:single-stranded-DNA-specific exonuclease